MSKLAFTRHAQQGDGNTPKPKPQQQQGGNRPAQSGPLQSEITRDPNTRELDLYEGPIHKREKSPATPWAHPLRS